MNVLLLGAAGHLGSELRGALGSVAHVTACDRSALDVTDAAAVESRLERAAPDVIVNAAAWTDVAGAEKNPAGASAVNTDAVERLGEAAKRRRIGLVHFSTDFVFDGRQSRPYREEDEAAPLNVYGRTKLDGERRLTHADAPAVILRTAWVYGLTRPSFVSRVLRLAREEGPSLRVVTDQVGNPTFARDLAQAVACLIYGLRGAPFEGLRDARGIYHLAGTGACSRHALASAALELDPRRAEHRFTRIDEGRSETYESSVMRPADSSLDCRKAAERFGLALPPWREALERALRGSS